MSRDDVRKLIGGYATGTLTDSERKVLFEAALEDQDLFDELAREQEMKDLLDEPGVKQRLLNALAPPPKRPLWIRAWSWAAATAVLALVIGVLIVRRPEPQQIAQFRPPEVRTAPQPETAPALEQAPPPISPPAASKRAIESAKVDEKPLLKTGSAPNPALDDLKKQDASKDEAAAANRIAAQAGAAAAPSAAQPQSAPPPTGGVVGGLVPPAPQLSTAFRAAPQAAPRQKESNVPARFAFDYAVTGGKLRVTPSANGFLNIDVTGSATTVTVSNRAVVAGSVTEIEIPADATLAHVTMSAQPLPANRDLSGIFDPRAPLSGTRADPNPSPNSRVTAVIPLKP